MQPATSNHPHSRSILPALLVLLALAYQALVPHGFMRAAHATGPLELVLAICNPHNAGNPVSVGIAQQPDQPISAYGSSGFCPYCPLFTAIDPPRATPLLVARIIERPLPGTPMGDEPTTFYFPGPPLGSRAPPALG